MSGAGKAPKAAPPSPPSSGSPPRAKATTVPLFVGIRVSRAAKRQGSSPNGISYSQNDRTITKAGSPPLPVSEVYGPDRDNEVVYNTRVSDIIDGILNGENGMVMVYGNAGSGKSHTMLGSPHNYGIIPRAIDQLYERVNLLQRGGVTGSVRCQVTVRISSIQVVHNTIRDIINPDNVGLTLVHQMGMIRVQGAEEVEAQREAAMELVDVGLENQTHHDRASTIFRVAVERRELMEDGATLIHNAVLHLVDVGCSSAVDPKKEDATLLKSLLSLPSMVASQVCSFFLSPERLARHIYFWMRERKGSGVLSFLGDRGGQL